MRKRENIFIYFAELDHIELILASVAKELYRMHDSLVTISYGAARLKMISSMEFDCKLAHKSDIKKISNFSSIRQLYDRISQTFSVPVDEILFCTLNTHRFSDMNSLLGNYLSIGDLIVVHMCGQTKSLSFKKKFEFLGLTITDNGFGRAFVKRVNSQDNELMKSIKPGQHIMAINSESTVGLRHFEVARALREVPVESEFTLRLMEPILSQENQDKFDQLPLNQSDKFEEVDKSLSMLRLDDNYTKNMDRKNSPTIEQQLANLSGSYPIDSLSDDLLNSSLPIDRLLRHTGSLTKDQAIYKHIIEDINKTLESFLGINDTTLAIQIYRLAKENKESFDDFVTALRSSELSVFKFGLDTERSLWRCAASTTSDPPPPVSQIN